MTAEQRTAEERGDLAERLVPIAMDLSIAVHDEGPDDVAAVLSNVGPDEWDAFAVVLAAMIEVDRPVNATLGWITFDEEGCSTQPPPPVLQLVPTPEPEPQPEPDRGGRPEPRYPRPPAVHIGNPRLWTREVLLDAHAAFHRGVRDEVVVVGEREYHRRRPRSDASQTNNARRARDRRREQRLAREAAERQPAILDGNLKGSEPHGG